MPRLAHDAPESVGRLAIDLANTIACPACRASDALASEKEMSTWVRRRLPEGTALSREDRSVLRQFRSDLLSLLDAAIEGTTPPRAALARVNRAAATEPFRPELTWRRGVWKVTPRPVGPRGAGRLAALSARSLLGLLSGAERAHLRRCSGPECVHYLIAHRPSQRWCSPSGCGNRARVRRHYRKIRSQRSFRTRRETI